MYVRLTMAEGISDADKAAALLGDNVVPALREQKGFVNLNASHNPETGAFGAISTWESLADLEASAKTADGQRQDFVAAIGGRIAGVATYELAVIDLASTPPGPGAAVVIVRGSMDPAIVDANLEFFKANVLTAAQQASGYRALRNMVDRQKGEFVVGAVFADRIAAQGWIDSSAQRRGEAESRGVQLETPELRNLIYAS